MHWSNVAGKIQALDLHLSWCWISLVHVFETKPPSKIDFFWPFLSLSLKIIYKLFILSVVVQTFITYEELMLLLFYHFSCWVSINGGSYEFTVVCLLSVSSEFLGNCSFVFLIFYMVEIIVKPENWWSPVFQENSFFLQKVANWAQMAKDRNF